jgi:AcrR family transcriptional regulator
MDSKKQSQRTSNRRSDILESASKCFSGQGFEASSIEEIGTLSGASVGSIYHHFGNKEGIASVLYLESLTNYYDELDVALENCKTIEHVIKTVVRHHIDWSVAHPDLTRYLLVYRRYSAIASVEEQIEALTRQKLHLFLDEIQNAVARGEILALPSSSYIAIIVGPCVEIVRLWAFNRLRGNIFEIRDALSDAAWRSLRNGSN